MKLIHPLTRDLLIADIQISVKKIDLLLPPQFTIERGPWCPNGGPGEEPTGQSQSECPLMCVFGLKILFLPSEQEHVAQNDALLSLYTYNLSTQMQKRGLPVQRRVLVFPRSHLVMLLEKSGHTQAAHFPPQKLPAPQALEPPPAPEVLSRLLSLTLPLRSRFISMMVGFHLPCFPVSGQWMGQNFYSNTTLPHPLHLHLIFCVTLSCPTVWFCLGYL